MAHPTEEADSLGDPLPPIDPFLQPRRSGGATQVTRPPPSAAAGASLVTPAPASSRALGTTNVTAAVNAPSTAASQRPPSAVTSRRPASETGRAAPAQAVSAAPAKRSRAKPSSPSSTGPSRPCAGSGSTARKRRRVASMRHRPKPGGLTAAASAHAEDSSGDELSDAGSSADAEVAAFADQAQSDDDREGDAEEKALLAAAGGIATSTTSTTTTAGSAGATPHPWLVTDAFHVSLWYVLRYAGTALSAADLWACRAMLSLTTTTSSTGAVAAATATPPPPTVDGEQSLPSQHDEQGEFADAVMGEEDEESASEAPPRLPSVSRAGAWAWTGSEESELLLRLVLRKPYGFTARHLELRYGDWLHVQSTLAALTQRRLLWWTARTAEEVPSTTLHHATESPKARGEEGEVDGEDETQGRREGPCDAASGSAGAAMSPAFMLEHYDGERVAAMVLGNVDEEEEEEQATPFAARPPTKATTSALADELTRVMQAVRGTELRLFLSALRHSSKAHAVRTSEGSEGAAAAPVAVSGNGDPSADGDSIVSVASRDGGRDSQLVVPTGARVSKDAAASFKNSPLGDNSLYDAIPGRKRDMIAYFVERRYARWAPTPQTGVTRNTTVDGASPFSSGKTAPATSAASRRTQGKAPVASISTTSDEPRQTATATDRGVTGRLSAQAGHRAAASVTCCFRSAEEEAYAISQCWDAHVGAVYAPHSAMKAHLAWMTEIFHVLTANGGAGAVGQQGLKPLAATLTVAAPPTLLMVRPQLLLLLQSLRSAQQLRREARLAQSGDGKTTAQEAGSDGVVVGSVKDEGEAAAAAAAAARAAFRGSVPFALLPRWFVSPTLGREVAAVSSSPDRGAPTNATIVAGVGQLPSYDVVETVPDSQHDELAEDSSVLCSLRSFHGPDVDDDGSPCGEGQRGLPPPVALFGTPAMLREYRAALYTHRALYEVVDGAASAAQRFRGRNEGFVTHLYDTVLRAVRAGVAAVKQHPLKASSPRAAGAAAVERFVAPLFPSPSPGPSGSVRAAPSLQSLVYEHGQRVEHLLSFTPLFRWFECLEQLYQLLQSARRYEAANECLRYLLDEPIYVLHHMPDGGGIPAHVSAAERRRRLLAAVSPVTYAFHYKTQKRGEWIARVAQNLSHMKRYPEALALLEATQSGYCELDGSLSAAPAATPTRVAPFASTSNPAAAALCGVLAGGAVVEGDLPVTVQRRSRLLRVLWPAAAAAAAVESSTAAHATPAAAHSAPLYHAVWEYVRERYCRRQDRLLLEKSLSMLHRRVRQWTPLAPRRQLATQQLCDVAVQRVAGVRDAMDYQLWREPSGQPSHRGGGAAAPSGTRRPALPVELFVLEHFLKIWNRPQGTDSGETGDGPWQGAHCEGMWLRCLAHALLWDCYWAYPTVRDEPAGTRQHGELLWLSAFQDGPLDVATSIGFLLRRRPLIERRLCELESATREELLAYVAARIRSEAPTAAEHPPSPARGKLDPSREQSGGNESDEEGEAARERDGLVGRGDAHRCGDADSNSISVSVVPSSLTAAAAAHCAADAGSSREATMAAGVAHLQSTVTSGAEEDSVLLPESPPPPPTTAGSVSIASISSAQAENTTFSSRRGDTGNAPMLDHAKAATPAITAASVPPTPPAAATDASGVPEAWKVPVGTFPLLDLLAVIPLPPLWRLLRCLYLSPVTEGIPLRFSGFPDLVFWRRETTAARNAAELSAASATPPFCLMEVKSPSDTLSTKQISVNDMLHRCGFQVCVLRVDAVHDNGEPVSTKKIR